MSIYGNGNKKTMKRDILDDFKDYDNELVSDVVKDIETYRKLNNPIYKRKLSKRLFRDSKGFYFSPLYKYAALIALPLFIALSIFLFTRGGEQEPILPGKEIALLELPKGEQIVVEPKTKVSNYSEALKIIGGLSTVSSKDYIDIVVPHGGVFSITLDDSTGVWLNSGSRMRVPIKFSKDQRRVFVEGEAFFKVKKDGRPFIVETDIARVKVLGTSFNINSYKDEPLFKTALLTGKIEVSGVNGKDYGVLSPGECISISRDSEDYKIFSDETELYSMWRHGLFKFREQSLEEIVRILKRWYDFDVKYSDEAVKYLRFSTIALKNRPLDDVLQLLQKTNSITYKRSGKRVIFSDNR